MEEIILCLVNLSDLVVIRAARNWQIAGSALNIRRSWTINITSTNATLNPTSDTAEPGSVSETVIWLYILYVRSAKETASWCLPKKSIIFCPLPKVEPMIQTTWWACASPATPLLAQKTVTGGIGKPLDDSSVLIFINFWILDIKFSDHLLVLLHCQRTYSYHGYY